MPQRSYPNSGTTLDNLTFFPHPGSWFAYKGRLPRGSSLFLEALPVCGLQRVCIVSPRKYSRHIETLAEASDQELLSDSTRPLRVYDFNAKTEPVEPAKAAAHE